MVIILVSLSLCRTWENVKVLFILLSAHSQFNHPSPHASSKSCCLFILFYVIIQAHYDGCLP